MIIQIQWDMLEILIDPVTAVKFGGADPRGDGAAVGY